MNTNKKISFLVKIYKKKIEKLTHYRPALRTETYQFEYIAQRNNVKTSYYVKRITSHYFPLKIQVLASRSNPGVRMGRFQRSDVTAAPRARASGVIFSKF